VASSDGMQDAKRRPARGTPPSDHFKWLQGGLGTVSGAFQFTGAT
jgi:hypothetical protein